MALRTGELYVSYAVRQCLRMLSQAAGGTRPSDAIATDVLQHWLETEHAVLWKWVQDRELDQEKMVAALAAQQPKKGKVKAA